MPRELGTMIAFGFPNVPVAGDLKLALTLGATCLEVLPDWSRLPSPELLRGLLDDHPPLSIWSAHAPWGGQSIRARKVDLASLDEETARESLDDLKTSLDWLAELGGKVLVIHPGTLSDPADQDARAQALGRNLNLLADHAQSLGITLTVENMPPGVHPGQSMSDLAEVVRALDRPQIRLALDTGHARITSSPSSAALVAGSLLKTTHVHDNDGFHDTHLPPGEGVIEWPVLARALEAIDYRGPIILECIRALRDDPTRINRKLHATVSLLQSSSVGASG
jgi:sugar phosphate isomerase/epimerase